MNEPLYEPRTREITCRCERVDRAQAEGVYAYCAVHDRASRYAGEPVRSDRRDPPAGPLAW